MAWMRASTALLLATSTSCEALKASTASRIAELRREGVVRVDGAIPPEIASALLPHVNGALEIAIAEVADGAAFELGASPSSHFGQVMQRHNRHDLKLDLTPPVDEAVGALLRTLGPTLSSCLGADAVLYECAALISDPHAPAQPIHPDTPYRDDQDLAVLTAFVALQPIDETMGPTAFIPGTHTAAAHAALQARGSASSARGDGTPLGAMGSLVGGHRPSWRGLLGTGDACVFDSRLLHCGLANESCRRRVLFYVSFRARDAAAPPGTLLWKLRERHSLEDWAWRDADGNAAT